jgi:DNA-binding MarR family transcriptional regulator
VQAPALTEDNGGEDADALGGLNDILGLRIRLAHGAVYRHFTETFAELDLTQKQVSALWLVHDRPGISQIDLGGRLRMDRATTMTIVNRLQERGYVRRERSTSDGRKQALYVTDAGAAALAEAKRCIGEHEAWLKGRFSAGEIDKLVEMLARIHE